MVAHLNIEVFINLSNSQSVVLELLRISKTLSGGSRGENYIHDNSKMLSAFFDVLAFALIVQYWVELPES